MILFKLAYRGVIAEIMASSESVASVLVFEGLSLVDWKRRDGQELAPASERDALIFQRNLIHGMLKNREKYAGMMHYNLTSYDTIDLIHIGLNAESDKQAILLIGIKRPYNTDEFISRVFSIIGFSYGEK